VDSLVKVLEEDSVYYGSTVGITGDYTRKYEAIHEKGIVLTKKQQDIYEEDCAGMFYQLGCITMPRAVNPKTDFIDHF